MQLNEIEALNNAVTNSRIEGLKVIEYYHQDKRKTGKKYFLSFNGASISPTLYYEQMNHFILGMIKANEILTTI